jgi:hypothetical protein
MAEATDFREGCCRNAPFPPAKSDVVSADLHGAIGIDQSGVQLLGGSELYHLSVRPKYPPQAGSERSLD